MQQQLWEQSEERKSQKRRSRTRDRQKRRSQRRERVRRRKTKVREKVGKSRNTVFFQWCVAPDGRKVGSLKRRARSHLVGWEIKNCTQLWHEANFEVKMRKTAQAQSIFARCRKSYEAVAPSAFPSQNVKNILGSDRFWKFCWDVQTAHAAVARSTFGNQNIKSTSAPEHFCAPLWREAHFEVKSLKTDGLGPLLDVEALKKCTRLWCEAHFKVNMVKTPDVWTTFGGLIVILRGRRHGFCTLSKVSTKRWQTQKRWQAWDVC